MLFHLVINESRADDACNEIWISDTSKVSAVRAAACEEFEYHY